MSESISAATTASDYEAFGGLVREYVDWCRERYQEHPWIVEEVFGHQSLDHELQSLAETYGPPRGKTLLAWRDGKACGGGAYRRLDDGTVEMKRLFISTRFQGKGTGRRLCDALIESVRAEGCSLIRLDTGNLFTEAIAMYKSIGFRNCPPHRHYPERLLPHLVFLELPLK